MTIPLAWALAGVDLAVYAAVVVGVIVLGIAAAELADRAWGTHDSGRIVIDEVAGYLVTVGLVDRSTWPALVVGFVVFRILDIVKPPPVRWIDDKLPGGAGVVLDDVAAGVMGAAVMVGLDRAGVLAELVSW